ncbi:hypothetical protein RJ640_020690 [Escallonia rubra]|uniref:MLO-like protein n=1 Tax=Escallonia rubra TaxID=112253 RepID=A0AA88RN42_9ASTE|nr:hypothetical protein RJ640_020690 [Escallonia rubra]
MAPGAGDRSLQETPTWAVAAVCAVFVIISIVIEHGIHSLGKWFQKRQNKAMIEALEKIKAELMLLGFISLLLTVGTSYVTKICITKKLGNTLLPCNENLEKGDDGNYGRRRLLSYAEDMAWRRVMSESKDYAKKDYCTSIGKVSLISYSGVHQLHIFIFVLAVFHVLYSVIIIGLGQAKMKKWKTWELETTSLEYQFTNDPARFRFAHQTSFVRRHAGWSTTPGIRWIVAFFRQFFGSISKAHFAPNSKFDFHKYIKRSMEDDFKVVLGIRVAHTGLALIGATRDTPLGGYKTRTGYHGNGSTNSRSDDCCKRSTPGGTKQHLFLNAYQMAFFLWTLYEFGITSCFHENKVAILVRVFFGIALHLLCSYITFPLYALVTQMGSDMKQAIFEEQTAKALKKWQKAAKERKKARKAGGEDASSAGFISGENTPSHGSSPLHLLHNHKHKASEAECESVPNSPMANYQSDIELSDLEAPSSHGVHDSRQADYPERKEASAGSGFTFVKL